MLKTEIDRIVDESASRLIQSSSPSIRYWVLRDVMMKDREDLAIQRALVECERYPPRRRILEDMNADGTWPVPKVKEGRNPSQTQTCEYLTHATMLKNLLRLLHFVTLPGDDRVNTSLEKLFSWQTKDGYIEGPMNNGLPQPHYNGYALYLAEGFYMEEDPKLNRLADWLKATQRRDGGWTMPYVQDVKYLPEYRHLRMDEFIQLMQTDERKMHDPMDLQDVPSCHWTTMMVLWGLNDKLQMRYSRCVQKGADFLLGRFFQRNPHSNFYESERNWTALKYPHNKCSGLAALHVLTKAGMGPDDPRMERPIRWLIDARYRDGFWTDSDRPHTEAGQWLSTMALYALERYAQRL
ncbi:MAG TPA: hypothetical protein HA364_09455 [Thermoplasmata archaeon]|nr:hypothetical protein [Thermoplasmata archaeon]